jgi:hypothetical protein
VVIFTKKGIAVSRSLPFVVVLVASVIVGGVVSFIGEAGSQAPVRPVAPLGASEGVAWYVDLSSRKIVACRLRSDPAALACSAHDMP